MTTRLSTALPLPLLLLAAACVSPPNPAVAPAAAVTPPATGTDPHDGLQRLDAALAMRHDHELWEQVGPAAEEAASRLERAARDGAPGATAGFAAAQALVAWQALCESGWTLDGQDAWTKARDASAAALLHWLDVSGDDVPESDAVRVLILLECDRDDDAGAALAAGLQRFPASVELNDEARSQRDHVPDPAGLSDRLEPAATRADARAEVLTTQGHLLLSAGLRAEAAGDATGAVTLYERGGRALAAAQQAPGQRLADWPLRQRLADCDANAGRLRLAAAQAQLAAAGLPAAVPDLQAAETDWSAALAALPDDDESRAGLAATADVYYQAGDLAGVRDAFGRLARRFDSAEWWNNNAFFCRETGRYEDALAAYERCLALEPDNARYINDTALILLYHLHRDLDRAETMFRHAIELGQKACDNPFSDDSVREENFGAFTDAMLNLSLLMARDGRFDEAAALCDQLVAAAPDREDARGLRERISVAQHGQPFPDDPAPAAPRTRSP